ncbi:uridine phosphorylase 1-like [Ptychodera flava]|uniref:uridine phosphorylase 1-like n=1 Tax=Ptychodera flava TaxID=63121 RepID=UPI003969F194
MRDTSLRSTSRFVCTGGSTTRMENFAKFVLKELSASGLQLDLPTAVENLCRTDRYVMYKVGPVLSVNHGIGMPSLSTVLNEVIKLLRYAGCTDVVFIRLGTSGGVGVEPGTVVIADEAVNHEFRPVYQLPVVGQLRSWPTPLSGEVVEGLKSCCLPEDGYDVVINKTMATDDFYEGQARLDGAFCDYTEEDKLAYLKEAYDNGVRNIDKEATCLAAMVNRANFKAGVACVALLNRLEGDDYTASPETSRIWEQRPPVLVVRYILKRLREMQGQ